MWAIIHYDGTHWYIASGPYPTKTGAKNHITDPNTQRIVPWRTPQPAKPHP